MVQAWPQGLFLGWPSPVAILQGLLSDDKKALCDRGGIALNWLYMGWDYEGRKADLTRTHEVSQTRTDEPTEAGYP